MIARLVAALLTLFALASLPARADTTAVYHGPGGVTFTIEISGSNIRTSIGGVASYSLILDGIGYTITPGAHGMIVERTDDITVVRTALGTLPRTNAGSASGSFLQRGTHRVAGHSGRVWLMEIDGQTDPRPFWVMSHDPKLAELGAGMRAHFDLGIAMAGGPERAMGPMTERFRAVLRTGAPLVFSLVLELASVHHDPIPATRFTLPGQPSTREQIRARLTGG